MIYGLISDIHANLEAFEAVLSELKGMDGYLCFGDIVGYGPDPGACIDRLHELPNLICVVGNHDLAAVGHYDLNWFNPYAGQAIVWTSQQLSSEQKSYLASLKPGHTLAEVVLCHGSLAEPMGYITGPETAMDCFDEMKLSVCFVGHTHINEYYLKPKGSRFCEQIPLWEGGSFELVEGFQYIINPGAVGQPRDGNPKASFGIYHSETRHVETRRVDYPIGRVQDKMRRAGLPEYLIVRLERGH